METSTYYRRGRDRAAAGHTPRVGMRIRSIKPEYWRSRSISCLSLEDRLLFIGLWSYVDDNGVGLDRLSTITADLFADDLERDPRGAFARVSRGLAKPV